jgi:uncharacterized protein
MAKAILFHGTGGSPDVVWLPWLDEQLTARGFTVERPSYPDVNVTPIADFLPRVLAAHTFDENTVLVGHSGGAALLLALLEKLETPVAQAVLVAGYCTRPNAEEEPVLQDSYDWDRIRANAGSFVFVNSANDPYGCNDVQGRAMFDRVGGTLVIRNDGHFGDWNQPYPTFPLLAGLIEG